MQKIYFVIVLALFLGGCQKYYISISQDKIDKEYLASSHVGTPDPNQKTPPLGDRLIIEWKVPSDFIKEKPTLHLHVIYHNYTEKYFVYPMPYQMDYVVYTLLGEEYKERKGILSYRAEIVKEDGTVFIDWKHQLWTRLIQIEKEPVLETSPSVVEEDSWREQEWEEKEESDEEGSVPLNYNEELEESKDSESSS